MTKKTKKSKAKKGKTKFDPNNLKEAKVLVKRSSMGLGLFAGENLNKGNFVIEYMGKPLTFAEAEYHPGRYLFEITARKTIDGSGRNNIARYINHSCRPNCEPHVQGGRVFIFAIKKIKADEELSYDYGEEYMKQFITPKGCLCGYCRSGKKHYQGRMPEGIAR